MLMSTHRIVVNVNGQQFERVVQANTTLSQFLRDQVGFVDVKESCGKGDCGSCAVIMNGVAVNSCLVLAVQADGAEILTVRGLEKWDKFAGLKESFFLNGAFQCGYCTPGVMIAIKALLDQIPNPSEMEIKSAIAGNLCRCGSYNAIVRAVQSSIKHPDEEKLI